MPAPSSRTAAGVLVDGDAIGVPGAGGWVGERGGVGWGGVEGLGWVGNELAHRH